MALLDSLLNLALDKLAEPINKAKRISNLINSGILSNLTRNPLSAPQLTGLIHKLGLGIGGEFSGAQRSRVVKELKKQSEIRRKLQSQPGKPTNLGDFTHNPTLFGEGFFGRRVRVNAVWSVVDPASGLSIPMGGALDFGSPPSMDEIRAQAYELASNRFNDSPTQFKDGVPEGDYFITGFEIISMERAF